MTATSFTLRDRLERAMATALTRRFLGVTSIMNGYDQIYGCAFCDVDEVVHGSRYVQLRGWHTYERPSAYAVAVRLNLRRDAVMWLNRSAVLWQR